MAAAGYQLLDSGDGRKLERFGSYVLARPCAQAVWAPTDDSRWTQAHARFERRSSGTGNWHIERKLPERWTLEHYGLTWHIHPNEHGNLGMFAEQEPSWSWIRQRVEAAGEVDVINLFGYTGGSTLAAASAGARVCHVDASKAMIKVARENAAASGLESRPVRWMAEDAGRFVERELRRGNRYHGIILDPPTYGRGPRGEVFKIDDEIQALVEQCTSLLVDDGGFVLLSSHSPGYTPLVLANLLKPGSRGEIEHGEMVLAESSGRLLPSGAYARWSG